MKNINIDLHVHTSWSDGTYTPETCIEFAKNASVDIMAITDHNSFEGIEEAIYFGKNAGIKIIPALEFNVNYIFNLHYLAYFKGDSFLKLQSYFYNLRFEDTKKTVQKALEILKKSGVKYDRRTLEKFVTAKHGGIEAVFVGLCQQGLFKTPYEAEKALFAEGAPCHFDNMFILSEVFSVIKDLGGKIFLAHPLVYGIDAETLEHIILPDLMDAGLDGLEVYHSQMNQSQSELLLGLCKKYGLKYSGGSDFHGEVRPGVDIGYISEGVRVPADALDDEIAAFVSEEG